MGSGATKRLSAVRWGVAGNIVVRLGADDPGRRARGRALSTSPVEADLRMQLGARLGQRADVRALLAEAGENARRDRAGGRAALPRVPRRRSVTQDDVKRSSTRATGSSSELLRSHPEPVRDAVRPRGHRHARLRGRRGARQDRERLRAARPLRRRAPDAAVARAVRPARRGDGGAREAARPAEGAARLRRRDRGRSRRSRTRPTTSRAPPAPASSRTTASTRCS